MGQGRRRGAARGALRPDLRARDRELARAAAGLERRPARDHAQEGRPRRPRGLRRARRRRGRERARRDVAGRAARALGQRLPAARRARRVAVPLRGDRRPGAGDGPGEGRRARARPAPRGPHAPDRRLHPRRPAARRRSAGCGWTRRCCTSTGARTRRSTCRTRAARSSATSTARAATRSRTGCRPRSRRASCRCSAAARSRPPRRTSSAAAPPSRARASTRPTSRSTRRARCARRSRSCCSARRAARARSASEVRAPLRRGRRRRSSPSSTAARTATVLDASTLERLPDSTREFIHELMDAMTSRLTVGAVLDEAQRQLDEFDPRHVRRLAARRRGADPPVAGVHAERVLGRHARAGCWRRACATAGSACPPTWATARGARGRLRLDRAVAGLPPPRLRGRADAGRAAHAPRHRAGVPETVARRSRSLRRGCRRSRSRSCSPAAAHAAPTRPACCRCCCPRCRRDQRPNLIVGASVGADQRRLSRRDAARRRRPRARRRPRDLGEHQVGRRARDALAARPRAASPARALTFTGLLSLDVPALLDATPLEGTLERADPVRRDRRARRRRAG